VTVEVKQENSNPEPAPVEVKEHPKYQQNLIQLEEMGFLDRVKNIQLLEKYNGNMLMTVKQLLEDN
jgi:hypothetical protein